MFNYCGKWEYAETTLDQHNLWYTWSFCWLWTTFVSAASKTSNLLYLLLFYIICLTKIAFRTKIPILKCTFRDK